MKVFSTFSLVLKFLCVIKCYHLLTSQDNRTHIYSPILTSFFVGVSATGLPESHQGPEVGTQDSPAEGGHGVDSHQAADEGVLTAL